MQISASGMHAAQTLFDVGAHNVSNISTQGYSSVRADLEPVEPKGGVAVGAIQRALEPGVDLATEVVGITAAKLTYTANAGVARTVAETQRYLLDVRV
jgi:flagellar hook-associated protein FlgK